MADQPRLNSLERFRKQPARLVLEEHSHCEVPAGCGGVVLRWRNPHATVPVTLYLYAPVQADCRVDGAALPSGRIDLTPGRHILTVALADVDLAGPLLMFAATFDPEKRGQHRPAGVVERPFTVASAADGTCKFTLRPPPEGWDRQDFDDRGWPALGQVPTPIEPGRNLPPWECRECAQLGAVCLGLVAPAGKKKRAWWQRFLGAATAGEPSGRGSVWARKVFDVPGPRAD